ncbi:uncharacterized protein FOMMEDRAFT_115057 [Fomitiporia mediterranea MF3/22]|uniref:CFA20 domain-containing protein n=1 Tax=Fomitiporia mediterranea (strain MF3/22) TaxID=694068 RepID=R7SH76_FOMME|nr:uncharacterized protein FOMMEDRAFT_115057 [Fomitiporia mediterranea MF3/22]EJC97730.1 hypothetical protein FOMMEDRAFT_115057 [Fomitiporia mediterranea MF3/22]
MFANVVQPSIISLFSSTGSAPLQLFSQHVDASPALRSDSLIQLLDDSTSTPAPPAPGVLILLHIQSPTLRTTFIRCPPLRTAESSSALRTELGLTLPWMYIQARSLGREWAFEVGITDTAGRRGVIRCSTFQKEPALKTNHNPPLLHIPLRLPTSQILTSWRIISIDLGYFTQQFQRARSFSRRYSRDGRSTMAPLPSGAFGKVTYVKVYANCRLRRIWFNENKHSSNLPWEFELYASSSK